MNIKVTNQESLVNVADAIHDLWFAVEAWEVVDGLVSVPLYLTNPTRRRSVTLAVGPSCVLYIGHVLDIDVHDQAQITWYDIASFDFREVGTKMRLRSAMPFFVDMTVSEIDISLNSRK